MHKEALLARLHAAWSTKPCSVALLAPLEASTVSWTYQDLSEQVFLTSIIRPVVRLECRGHTGVRVDL